MNRSNQYLGQPGMDFTTANVERAVMDFYASGQTNHEWLTCAQLSPEAWTFAWDLIRPEKSPQVQFFGANTLAIKLTKNYRDVPQSDFPALRQRLVTLFQESAKRGPKIVLTRICVAVAATVINSAPDPWPTPVQDMVSSIIIFVCSQIFKLKHFLLSDKSFTKRRSAERHRRPPRLLGAAHYHPRGVRDAGHDLE